MKSCRTLKLVTPALFATTQSDAEPLSVIESLRRRKTMLSVPDLAELLGMGRRTIYTAVKSGRIPSVRVCGTVRLDPIRIAAWLERNSMGSIAA